MPTDESLSRVPELAAPLADRHELEPATPSPQRVDSLPPYLPETYSWAYLNPVTRWIFDHPIVVSAILWGNNNRLIRAVRQEVVPGSRVLQTACVYGSFSVHLADRIGPAGRLDIIDVAPLQVTHCRQKLDVFPHCRVTRADAARFRGDGYDAACCFFLLHEVPDDYKTRIVDNLLASVRPGGKIIFVDYHAPRPWHPARPVMRQVFRQLEPFALPLWDREIRGFATDARDFSWAKQTYFGGLYQKVVAIRAGR